PPADPEVPGLPAGHAQPETTAFRCARPRHAPDPAEGSEWSCQQRWCQAHGFPWRAPSAAPATRAAAQSGYSFRRPRSPRIRSGVHASTLSLRRRVKRPAEWNGRQTRSAQRNNRACCTLGDSVKNPLVYPSHGLVEVLLRHECTLIRGVGLHGPQQLLETLLHIGRGLLSRLDHSLGIHAQLFQFLQVGSERGILSQRITCTSHCLVFVALADKPAEFTRAILEHQDSPSRLATTNRSRPVKSISTRTAVYAPWVATSSATVAARRTSTSSASTPPASSTAAA